jgi:release factor glutamine methyltransferase
VLGLERVDLYLRLEDELTDGHSAIFSVLLQRRIAHEPAAYITGRKEFFGLDFEVSPSVLIPRPETELLVERAIELAATRFGDSCVIGDVGTGCGAIAVALATKLPHARIYATDISASALEVARRNCNAHGVTQRVTLLQGNLLDPLPEPVHIVIANLPYVPAPQLKRLALEVSQFEPLQALTSDGNGLGAIRRLVTQAGGYLRPGGAILLEIGRDQGRAVCAVARERFPTASVSVSRDLAGLDRVVSIVTP